MNYYFPYKNREDAINEFNSLRTELLESQKQRITLLTASIAFITAIFAFLSKDKNIEMHESVILIYLSIIPCIYSYSTRIRERRIANYISIFLKDISPWSDLSSSGDKRLKLNLFQRSSTSIILGFVLFDIIIFLMSMRESFKIDKFYIIGIIGFLINVLVLIFTVKLKSFKPVFRDELKTIKKNAN